MNLTMKRMLFFLQILFFTKTVVSFLSRAPITSTGLVRHCGHSSSCCFAQKRDRPTSAAKPLPSGLPSEDINLPPDCTMDDLISVLGSGRIKKMARKNRRIRNDKIREGKVVMNEKGEWVPVK